jgi:hypothetical protein
MPAITTSVGVRLSGLDGGAPTGPPVVVVAGLRASPVRAAVMGERGHAANIERPDQFRRVLFDVIRSRP